MMFLHFLTILLYVTNPVLRNESLAGARTWHITSAMTRHQHHEYLLPHYCKILVLLCAIIAASAGPESTEECHPRGLISTPSCIMHHISLLSDISEILG